MGGLSFGSVPHGGDSTRGHIIGHSPTNTAAGTFNTIANTVGQSLSCRRRSQSRAGSKNKKPNDEGSGLTQPSSQSPHALGNSDVQKNESVGPVLAKAANNSAILGSGGAAREGETLLEPEFQEKTAINVADFGPSLFPEGGLSLVVDNDNLPNTAVAALIQQCSSGRGACCAKRPSSCRGSITSSLSSPMGRVDGCARSSGTAIARHRSGQPMRNLDWLTQSS